MLVLGSGRPHLIRGAGMTPYWQGVVSAASGLALMNGIGFAFTIVSIELVTGV